MKTMAKVLVCAVLLLVGGTVVAQGTMNNDKVKTHNEAPRKVEINVGYGGGLVFRNNMPAEYDNIVEGNFYQMGMKARLLPFNEHLGLVASLSADMPGNTLLLTATAGLESTFRITRNCSYFTELSVGTSKFQCEYDADLELAVKAAVGMAFDRGFTLGLQLLYVPTFYVTRSSGTCTPYSYEQLFTLGLRLGWFIL